jgi:hypothetical protein
LRRNCFLKRVIQKKIQGRKEVTERRGRRINQLLDDLKQRRGYCKLKEEALDRNVWRTIFGRVCGPVVRETKSLKGSRYIAHICSLLPLETLLKPALRLEFYAGSYRFTY